MIMSRSAAIFIAFFVSLALPFILACAAHWAIETQILSLNPLSCGHFPQEEIALGFLKPKAQTWHLIGIEDPLADHKTSELIDYFAHLFQKAKIQTLCISTKELENDGSGLRNLELSSGSIMVVNPEGYLALYFDADTSPKSMIRDLKTLLSR